MDPRIAQQNTEIRGLRSKSSDPRFACAILGLLRKARISTILLTSGSPFGLWINPILFTSDSPFRLWINLILLTSGSPFALWISLILLTSGSLFGLWMNTILLTSGSLFGQQNPRMVRIRTLRLTYTFTLQ